MTLRRDLVKIRTIVEKGWRQRGMASNDAGEARPVRARDATHFCVLGAIERGCIDYSPGEDYWRIIRKKLAAEIPIQKKLTPFVALMDYNDAKGRTKEQVLALFDKAIAKLPKDTNPYSQ